MKVHAPVGAPDDETLGTGLRMLLAPGGAVHVIDRVPNLYTSTSPSEVVTVALSGGRTVRVLCKYGTGMNGSGHGHRGGVAYEGHVYRVVLAGLGASAARCHGVYVEPGARRTWLVLEYLEPTVRLNQMPNNRGLYATARWIGAFHRATSVRADDGSLALKRYDADYLHGWAHRAQAFAADHPLGAAWLEEVCRRADEFVVPLLAAQPVVVHGELYPLNVLLVSGRVVPIDWESAAITAGELDLASLTELWPRAVVRRCEREYVHARWPDGAPADFARTLAAARVYWPLRWLGDNPESADEHRWRWCFGALHAAARELGILGAAR